MTMWKKTLPVTVAVALSTVVFAGCVSNGTPMPQVGLPATNPPPPSTVNPPEVTPTEPGVVSPEPPTVGIGDGSESVTATPQEVIDAVIGETLEGARGVAESKGYTTRVVKEDGEDLVGTMDYRGNRVNLDIENGKVVAAKIG